MADNKNYTLKLTNSEETAYKLYCDLKSETPQAIFNPMQEKERNQYLLELYISCLRAVKEQYANAPELPSEK